MSEISPTTDKELEGLARAFDRSIVTMADDGSGELWVLLARAPLRVKMAVARVALDHLEAHFKSQALKYEHAPEGSPESLEAWRHVAALEALRAFRDGQP